MKIECQKCGGPIKYIESTIQEGDAIVMVNYAVEPCHVCDLLECARRWVVARDHLCLSCDEGEERADCSCFEFDLELIESELYKAIKKHV